MQTAVRTAGRWLMEGPKRRQVFDVATAFGLRALGGKIRGGAAKGLRFHGGDTLGYLLGQSEPAVQRALMRYLPPGGVFFDVGANIGFMTLLGCRLVGPSGEVHAFEPLEENLRQLRRNLAANDFQAQIHPVALSNHTGPVEMVTEGALGRAHFGGGDVTVPAVRLDELELPAPTLVKIDVEGAEGLVLAGMRDMLAEHRPVLIVEIHGEQVGHEVEAFLGELGYTVERLADGGMPHLLAT